jgi:drug/metabolite transporter (DMT)-like permease
MRHADTSVVASLFSLGKIFVPLFAFFFVGERLPGLQYLGFLILTVTSILITLDFKKMRLNRAFMLMLVVSTILSLQSVLLKYVYDQGVGYGTSIVWMALFQFFISGVLMISPQNWTEIRGSVDRLKSVFTFVIGMELLSWAGTLGSYYALYLIPVSIAKGIASTQPIFVLVYALLFAKLWPNVFKEYLGRKDVIKKVILFIVMILGIMLVTGV